MDALLLMRERTYFSDNEYSLIAELKAHIANRPHQQASRFAFGHPRAASP